MPLLMLSGEKAGGPFLIEQGKMVATDVEGVLVKGRGHWLMEEARDQVIPKLVEFLNRQDGGSLVDDVCDSHAKNLGMASLSLTRRRMPESPSTQRACGNFRSGVVAFGRLKWGSAS